MMQDKYLCTMHNFTVHIRNYTHAHSYTELIILCLVGDDSKGSDNDNSDHGSSSGYLDDASGDDDNIDAAM